MNLKGKFSKFLGAITATVMGITMLPQVSLTSFAASPGDKLSVGNGTSQHKGVSDGYSYEIWIDSTGGSGSMTLGNGGAFKAEWSANVSRGNFLARRGKDYGSTTKATQVGNIVLDYAADYRQTGSASGNSRLCVYGWFQNKGAAGNVPLVEYYIIEDWVDWVPDAQGKMVTIDGAQYKIFQMDHTGPTINGGSETFKQYFSVRQQKRKSGTITVSDHFKAWESQGWGIGNLYEVALNAEGWQSSGVADITKLVISDKAPTTTTGTTTTTAPIVTQAPTSTTANASALFFDTFESGVSGWTARGDCSAAVASNFGQNSNSSLYITNRSQSWHGATAIKTQIKAGGTYNLSAQMAYNNSTYSSQEFVFGVQYDDGGTTTYQNVDSQTTSSGKWVELAGEISIPSSATNISLYAHTKYVETPSAEDLIDFYLDNVEAVQVGEVVEGTTVTLPINNTGDNQMINGVWSSYQDVSWIDVKKPMVAFTFDDGPVGTASSATSIRIQDALKSNGFNATFFYWGNKINSSNSAEITRAFNAGFEIGNHTYTHPNLTSMSASQISDEYNKTSEILKSLTGLSTFLFRPPYLSVNDTVKSAIPTPLINCGIDSKDWDNASKDAIVNTIKTAMSNGTLNGQIVLMHETYSTTAGAMEEILPYLKQQGWQVVSVSQLFKARGQQMKNGNIYNSCTQINPQVTAITTTATTTTSQTTTTTTKATTTSATTTTAPSVVYGDFNGDGRVTNVDLVTISQHLVGDIQLSGANLQSADVTNDGKVDVADLALMKQFIMGDYVVLGKR